MSGGALLDSSVVLASLDPDEAAHAVCDRMVARGGHHLYVHALAEIFSILTGGRDARRVDSADAVSLLQESVLPFVQTISLSGKDVMTALSHARERGVRGGAVYDYLHLTAARKAGAASLITLDLRHFKALWRPGDPEIASP